MLPTRENMKLFWNSRARHYPLPFDPAIAGNTRRILRLLSAMGVQFTGSSVVDIGCGTGVYALFLAREAGTVTGVDSSAAMLKIFKAERGRRGIKNAACVLSAWDELPAAAVRGKFDIALASMTMAVKTRADLLKMEAAARRCVYIGWAGVRRNSLLEKVYAAHGLEYKAPEGAERALALLAGLGRAPAVKYIRDSWEKEASPEETLREIGVNMRVNGAEFRRDWTKDLLAGLTRGGKIRQVTRARKALITWQAPPWRRDTGGPA